MRILIATIVGLLWPMLIGIIVYPMLTDATRPAFTGMVLLAIPLTAASVAVWLSDTQER